MCYNYNKAGRERDLKPVAKTKHYQIRDVNAERAENRFRYSYRMGDLCFRKTRLAADPLLAE